MWFAGAYLFDKIRRRSGQKLPKKFRSGISNFQDLVHGKSLFFFGSFSRKNLFTMYIDKRVFLGTLLLFLVNLAYAIPPPGYRLHK